MTGLLWLKPGKNIAGSAPGSDIALPGALPATFLPGFSHSKPVTVSQPSSASNSRQPRRADLLDFRAIGRRLGPEDDSQRHNHPLLHGSDLQGGLSLGAGRWALGAGRWALGGIVRPRAAARVGRNLGEPWRTRGTSAPSTLQNLRTP